MRRLGLVVNPTAGVGGRLGLKGSDGSDIARIARDRGAIPGAGGRAEAALGPIAGGVDIEVVTWGGEMGEGPTRKAGLAPSVVGTPAGVTTAADTRQAASAIVASVVDLLLFVGGDGTARDIYDAVGTSIPVLGIPAGVKMYSACFASHPLRAGAGAIAFLDSHMRPTTLAEVIDLDEEAMREGRLSTSLHGYVAVPAHRPVTQGLKAPTPPGDAAAIGGIARAIVEKLGSEACLVLGPGSTTFEVGVALGVEPSLLGVDVVDGGTITVRDGDDASLLASLLAAPAEALVVSPIGGQGFVFGRGNQQISPEVIRAVGVDRIRIVAAPSKITALEGRPLRVDTGDLDLDQELSGLRRVVVGASEQIIYPVRPAASS